MPTYSYRCTKGHEFEVFQSMADEPVKRCPECKSKVQRVYTPVGIVLKGSGFHKNDYRSSSKKPSTDSGSKSEKSEKSSETKSDTKSETKSESKSSDSSSAKKDG